MDRAGVAELTAGLPDPTIRCSTLQLAHPEVPEANRVAVILVTERQPFRVRFVRRARAMANRPAKRGDGQRHAEKPNEFSIPGYLAMLPAPAEVWTCPAGSER